MLSYFIIKMSKTFVNQTLMVDHYIKELEKIKNKISVKKGINIDFAIDVIKSHFSFIDDETNITIPLDATVEELEDESGESVIKTQRIERYGNKKDCLIIKKK